AFGNALGFDALVVPRATADAYAGYTNEDHAADYPAGYYELHLQMAAEAGDQRELDALLGRRSVKETWRLGLTLLAGILAPGLTFQWVARAGRPRERHLRAAAAGGMVGAGDPWTALGLLHEGNRRWGK